MARENGCLDADRRHIIESASHVKFSSFSSQQAANVTDTTSGFVFIHTHQYSVNAILVYLFCKYIFI